MVNGFRWKPILRADQPGLAKKVLCLSLLSQDGWPSFRLAIYLSPFLYIVHCQPIEPRMHVITFLSYRLAHTFTPGEGSFSVFSHCLRPRGAFLDLGAHSSHCLFSSLHHCISSRFIGRVIHLIFSILSATCFVSSPSTPMGDHPQFITQRVVMSFPLSILRTLIQGSLA